MYAEFFFTALQMRNSASANIFFFAQMRNSASTIKSEKVKCGIPHNEYKNSTTFYRVKSNFHDNNFMLIYPQLMAAKASDK